MDRTSLNYLLFSQLALLGIHKINMKEDEYIIRYGIGYGSAISIFYSLMINNDILH